MKYAKPTDKATYAYSIIVMMSMFDGEIKVGTVACGLTGQVRNDNVFDLKWDEDWVGRFANPEKYRDRFMAAIERMQNGNI